MVRALAKDISVLIVPSPERALALDRGYLALVRAQSFEKGRDVILGASHVLERVEQDDPIGIEEPVAPPLEGPRRRALALIRAVFRIASGYVVHYVGVYRQ